MDISAINKSEKLKQNIFQQLHKFQDHIINISENVGAKLFQQMFIMEINNLKQKIDYEINAIEQECSQSDGEEENESTRF